MMVIKKFYKNRGFIYFERQARYRKVAFFDRDGVLNSECGHITRQDQLIILNSGVNLIKKYRKLGYGICILTNQSSIGRGWLTVEQYENITRYLLKNINGESVTSVVDAVITCPYYLSGVKEYSLNNCSWRKPNSGMIEFGLKFFAAERARCIFFGDQETDRLAAKKARIKFYKVSSNEN